MVTVVKVETLADKLANVEVKALVDTLAKTIGGIQALQQGYRCYTLAKVEDRALVGWFLGVADHQMTSPLACFVFLTIIRFKYLFNLYKYSFRQTNAKCLSVCQYRQIH